jgi:sporulation protein YlmC with PRC-barrel domain
MEEQMRKIMLILVAMTFIAFGFAAGASATGMDKSMGKDAKKDVSALIGKDVKNPQGEKLGEVKNFVHDSSGEISLAVISHGGFMGIGKKDVAVPYSALTFNEGENHFVLNATKDQLAGAPAIMGDQNLSDRTFAEEVYRYFGERPYWTDEGMKSDKSMKSDDMGMKSGKDAGTHEYFGSDSDLDTGRDIQGGASPDMGMDSGY